MSVTAASVIARPPRVEYLSFANAVDHREYRFAVHAGEAVETRVIRIALSAFGPQLRLQDGPDVCYQILMQAMAAGVVAGGAAITATESDLASYLTAHTAAPKRRTMSQSPNTPVKPPYTGPRGPIQRRAPVLPVAPPAPESRSAFEEGQRVSHPVYGIGVTTSSGGGHTSVTFDDGGPRTFITSMLELDILSGPRTWETTARGKNRPRESDASAR